MDYQVLMESQVAPENQERQEKKEIVDFLVHEELPVLKDYRVKREIKVILVKRVKSVLRLRVRRDYQVDPAKMDETVSQGLLVKREIRVYQGFLEITALEACLDQLEGLEKKVTEDCLEIQVQVGLTDYRDKLVKREKSDIQVKRVTKDHQDCLDCKVKKETWDYQERQEETVCLDRKETEACLEMLAPLDCLESLAIKEMPDFEVLMAETDRLEKKVLRENPAHRQQLLQEVHLDPPGFKELMGILVRLAQLDCLVWTENEAKRVILAQLVYLVLEVLWDRVVTLDCKVSLDKMDDQVSQGQRVNKDNPAHMLQTT